MKDQEQDILLQRSGTTPSSNNETTASTIKTEYSLVSVPIKIIKKQILDFNKYDLYKPASLYLEQEDEEKIKRTLTTENTIKQKHITFPKSGVMKSNCGVSSSQTANNQLNSQLIEKHSKNEERNQNESNIVYVKKKPINQPQIISLGKTMPLQYRGNISNGKANKDDQDLDLDKEEKKQKKEKEKENKKELLCITKCHYQEIICNNNENSTITFRMENDTNKKLVNKVKQFRYNQCVNVASFQLIGIKRTHNNNNNKETDLLVLQKYLTQYNKKVKSDKTSKEIKYIYNYSDPISTNINKRIMNDSKRKKVKANDIQTSNIQLQQKKQTKPSSNSSKEKKDINPSYIKKKIKTLHQKRKEKVQQTQNVSGNSNSNRIKNKTTVSDRSKINSSNSNRANLSFRFDTHKKQNLKSLLLHKYESTNNSTVESEQSINSKQNAIKKKHSSNLMRNEKNVCIQNYEYKPLFRNYLKPNDNKETIKTMNNSKIITDKNQNNCLSSNLHKYLSIKQSDIINGKLNLNENIKINNYTNYKGKHQALLSYPKYPPKKPLNIYNLPYHKEEDLYFTNGDIQNYSHFNTQSCLNTSNNKLQPSLFSKEEPPIMLRQTDKVYYNTYNFKNDTRNSCSNLTLTEKKNHFTTISLLDEMLIDSSLMNSHHNNHQFNTTSNIDPVSNSFINNKQDEYIKTRKFKKEIYTKAFEKPDYKSFEKKRGFSENTSIKSEIKHFSFRKCLYI